MSLPCNECPGKKEGRQGSLSLMPPGVLDLEAHRGQEKLWLGFSVLVVTPPWEVGLRGPCLLDVKMNQLSSDDAGKSVKGTSAAPVGALSSDGGATPGLADSPRERQRSPWEGGGVRSAFLLPPLLKAACTSLKGSLLWRRLGYHLVPPLSYAEGETKATVGK